jgi:hypothetical protein
MSSAPTYDPRLEEADILAIHAAIAETPGVDGRVIYAGLEDDGRVRVRTGIIHGPGQAMAISSLWSEPIVSGGSLRSGIGSPNIAIQRTPAARGR